MLTERQQAILENVIKQYIGSAEPISSHLLAETGGFRIKPATIRLEMQKLTEEGYLEQPHTSAGRIPTDKGYRFFVDGFLEENHKKADLDSWANGCEETEDSTLLLHQIIRVISDAASCLTVAYATNLNLLIKDGWEEVLKQPELQDAMYLKRFIALLEEVEEGLDEIIMDSNLQIFIGRENPFSHISDFSTIVMRYQIPAAADGLLAIVGPKRMPYDRNISILESIPRLIENLYYNYK